MTRIRQFFLVFSAVCLQLASTQTLDFLEINAEISERLTRQLDNADSDEPVVFRMDKIADELVERANSGIAAVEDRVSFVMQGLLVNNLWSEVLYDPRTGQSDLALFAATLLGLSVGVEPYPGFLESRDAALDEQAQGRNFTEEIVSDFTRVYESIPPPFSASPLYQVWYGYKDATNAKTIGFIPDGSSGAGRCVILINLGANKILEPNYLSIITLHETWHCYHSPSDTSTRDLLKTSMREGVVTYLTSQMNPDFEEHDLLFWTPEELAAAESRKREILEAFDVVRSETDPAVVNQWLFGGIPLSTVPGAPPRCAYYVAWLSLQAYVEQLPASSQRADFLLDQTDDPNGREEMWQALVTKEGLYGVTAPPTDAPPTDAPTVNDSSAAFDAQPFLWIFVSFVYLVASLL